MRIILSFGSVIRLTALLGFCSGIIFSLFFLGLCLYPDDQMNKPSVMFAFLIPIAGSAMFSLHAMLAYPIFYWICKRTGGLHVEYSKAMDDEFTQ